MTTHPYGIAERDNGNNHSAAWALQVAAFSRFTGDTAQLSTMRAFFKEKLVPGQMAPDGSFPRELARTKPYGYSLFQLDVMGMLAEALSTPSENMWRYSTADGRGMAMAVEFMFPFIEDKTRWPRPPDVQYFDVWPIRHPALLFGGHRAARALVRRAMEDSRSGSHRGRGDPQLPGAPAAALGALALRARRHRLDARITQVAGHHLRVVRDRDLRLLDLGMPPLLPLEAVVSRGTRCCASASTCRRTGTSPVPVSTYLPVGARRQRVLEVRVPDVAPDLRARSSAGDPPAARTCGARPRASPRRASRPAASVRRSVGDVTKSPCDSSSTSTLPRTGVLAELAEVASRRTPAPPRATSPGTQLLPNTRTYGVPSALAMSMKRRVSAIAVASFAGVLLVHARPTRRGRDRRARGRRARASSARCDRLELGALREIHRLLESAQLDRGEPVRRGEVERLDPVPLRRAERREADRQPPATSRGRWHRPPPRHRAARSCTRAVEPRKLRRSIRSQRMFAGSLI